MSVFIMAVGVFVLTYAAIMSERIDKTVAVLVGASLVLFMHVLPQEKAFHAIDMNVLLLLIGMMVIVHIMSQTGVFQWIAIKLAKIAKGEPLTILILLSIATAVISAFLDNVTTVILIAPVTFLIADELRIDPVPFVIVLAIASNIGGTATLIGDPPNILIGSAADLSFMDFVVHLAPAVAIILVFMVGSILLLFRKSFHVSLELKARIKEMNEKKAIRDYPLLRKSLIVLSGVVILFFLHHALHYEAATVALGGAAILLLWSRSHAEEVFKHIEWPTIFFFLGLFIMVEALVEVGAIKMIAESTLKVTKGNLTITTMFILWLSGIASTIVNNIPYAATMIPLVKQVGGTIMQNTGLSYHQVFYPLWWSLALGTCLGGNGTLIGASANVVLCDIAKKNGHKVTFWHFSKYGMFFMIQSMLICSGYLYVRYLMIH